MKYQKKHIRSICLIVTILIFLQIPATSKSQGYLSGEDVALLSAASVGIAAIGVTVKNHAGDKKSLITGPILFDAKLQRILGGDCRAGKTNFLDNTFGSVLTPAMFGTALFIADSKWPETDSKGKFVAQDMFLYTTGLIATKGVTSLTKGLVSRQRPLPCLEPDIAGLRSDFDYAYDHNSFFSGHASSSFFAATYLNKRLRSIMRHQMSNSEYHDWSWAPPAILYGWSTFVGWTRIQAYKHFFTDVVAGALAGYLIGELFYSLNDYDELSPSSPSSGAREIFTITLKF